MAKRRKARDPKAAQDFMDGKAVKAGNRAAERRAKEAAMDKKDKKPVAKKVKGGSMTARGMGAAKKGGKFSRAG